MIKELICYFSNIGVRSMNTKLIPNGKCHECGKPVKGKYLYCYACNYGKKLASNFVKQQKAMIAEKEINQQEK
jgi:hypothetical protein